MGSGSYYSHTGTIKTSNFIKPSFCVNFFSQKFVYVTITEKNVLIRGLDDSQAKTGLTIIYHLGPKKNLFAGVTKLTSIPVLGNFVIPAKEFTLNEICTGTVPTARFCHSKWFLKKFRRHVRVQQERIQVNMSIFDKVVMQTR